MGVFGALEPLEDRRMSPGGIESPEDPTALPDSYVSPADDSSIADMHYSSAFHKRGTCSVAGRYRRSHGEGMHA